MDYRRVASERPSKFVRTVHPAFVSLRATADPIAPAAITAISMLSGFKTLKLGGKDAGRTAGVGMTRSVQLSG